MKIDRSIRPPRHVWRWLVAVLVVGIGVGLVVGTWRVSGQHPHAPVGYRSGTCIVIAATEPGGELHGREVNCDVDGSFAVAKIADGSDSCGQVDYTRFSPPFTDVATGRLCLIPNLVVGHCYRYGVPIGMWDPVGCAGSGWAAIKVSGQTDGKDQHACPTPHETPTPGIRTAASLPELRFVSRVYCLEDARNR